MVNAVVGSLLHLRECGWGIYSFVFFVFCFTRPCHRVPVRFGFGVILLSVRRRRIVMYHSGAAASSGRAAAEQRQQPQQQHHYSSRDDSIGGSSGGSRSSINSTRWYMYLVYYCSRI